MWWIFVGCEQGTVGLGHDRVADNVLAQVIQVRRRGDPAGWLRCEGLGVDGEVHEVPLGPDPEVREEIFLAGLLADTTYRCTVPDAKRAEVLEFTTDPLPDGLPTASLVEDGPAGGDYVFLNHGTNDKDDRETKILVYDAEGRLRWYHWVPYNAPDLDVHWLGDGTLLYGGGYRALPTVIDLRGEVVLAAPGPFEPDGAYNHTVERLADGTYLTTETSPNRDPAQPANEWSGFVIERLSPEMDEVVWSVRSQDLVDRGELPVPTNPLDNDPYHLNALEWLDQDGEVAASLYRLSEVLWVDVDARAVVDRFGWRSDWALVDDAGEPLPAAEWFYGQHAVEVDGDRVLLHDNGTGRPSPAPYSRAVEYTLDPATRTARVSWEWTEPGWFEPIWGDVDRLPDGRVSVTRAHCSKCSLLTEQRTEVVVVDPSTGAADWRLRFSAPSDTGYRSEWYDGCGLFHRVGTCDE